MSSPIVAVNIVRRPGPHALHAVRTRSFVQLDGTVADLRQALQVDQVIKPTDKFYIDGRALANTSEKYTKWTDVLRVRTSWLRDAAAINPIPFGRRFSSWAATIITLTSLLSRAFA